MGAVPERSHGSLTATVSPPHGPWVARRSLTTAPSARAIEQEGPSPRRGRLAKSSGRRESEAARCHGRPSDIGGAPKAHRCSRQRRPNRSEFTADPRRITVAKRHAKTERTAPRATRMHRIWKRSREQASQHMQQMWYLLRRTRRNLFHSMRHTILFLHCDRIGGNEILGPSTKCEQSACLIR